MSNLNLPKMTARNLDDIIKGAEKKIAYATIAQKIWNDSEGEYNYIVLHHDNVIAHIGRDVIYLSNAGWDSRTTADRLNRICRDNEMPFAVAIVQSDMTLFRAVNGTRDRIASFSYVNGFNFRRTASSWECVR
jgi:hypothetical protein